jgi:hypothetical protein
VKPHEKILATHSGSLDVMNNSGVIFITNGSTLREGSIPVEGVSHRSVGVFDRALFS